MISGIAAPITVFQTGCHWSAGRVSATAASGTNTSSSTTVCEPVARSPSVSHVSSMLTPSALNGTEQWITCGPSGASSQRMLVTSTSPTSQPLAGPLRALDPEATVDLARRCRSSRPSRTRRC